MTDGFVRINHLAYRMGHPPPYTRCICFDFARVGCANELTLLILTNNLSLLAFLIPFQFHQKHFLTQFWRCLFLLILFEWNL